MLTRTQMDTLAADFAVVITAVSCKLAARSGVSASWWEEKFSSPESARLILLYHLTNLQKGMKDFDSFLEIGKTLLDIGNRTVAESAGQP